MSSAVSLIDLVPLPFLAFLAASMYRDGYRLRGTALTGIVLFVAAALLVAGLFFLTTPARQAAILAAYLGLFFLFALRTSPILVTWDPRRSDTYGGSLLRIEDKIAAAQRAAIEKGRAGLLTPEEVADVYRRGVETLRSLDPPSPRWRELTEERISLHDRNLAYLAEGEFTRPVPDTRAESESWRKRVLAELGASPQADNAQ